MVTQQLLQLPPQGCRRGRRATALRMRFRFGGRCVLGSQRGTCVGRGQVGRWWGRGQRHGPRLRLSAARRQQRADCEQRHESRHLAVQRRSLRVTDATPRRRRQPDPDRVGAPGRRCIGGKGGSAALRQVQRAAERRVGDTSGTPRRLGSRCRSCTVRGRRRTGPRRRRPVAEADLEGARGSGLRDVVRGPALVRGSGEGGRRGMAGRRTRPQLVGRTCQNRASTRPAVASISGLSEDSST